MEIQSFWNTLQNSLGQSLMQWLGALTVVVAAWLLAVIARAATHVALSKIKLNDRMQDALGTPMNWQGLIAGALFWLVILLGLGAALNTVELNFDSGPLSGITNQLLEFTPRLLAAAALGVVAWLAASIVRGAVNKAMSAGKLDDKLPTSAHMPPIGERLGQMLFWLVILLFVPAVLQALDMRALLDPVNAMLTQALSFVPNIVAAVVVGGVGWLVAKVLQQLVMQLLSSMGSDDWASQAGLSSSLKLSHLAGIVVFLAVFIPSLIAALDALRIESISGPATNMLNMVVAIVPSLVAAALILLVTWVVARFVAGLICSLLAALGIDGWPEQVGLGQVFKRTPITAVAGRLFVFFAMLFAAVEAARLLGFEQFGALVTTFIQFGANVLLGSVILMVGFWLSNLAFNAIDQAAGSKSSGLARIARLAILGLVLAMGLRAMGIADDIVNLAFALVLGALAVAFAVAFGLGGREAAGELAKQWLADYRNNK